MGWDWTIVFHVEPLGSMRNSVRTICRESVRRAVSLLVQQMQAVVVALRAMFATLIQRSTVVNAGRSSSTAAPFFLQSGPKIISADSTYSYTRGRNRHRLFQRSL